MPEESDYRQTLLYHADRNPFAKRNACRRPIQGQSDEDFEEGRQGATGKTKAPTIGSAAADWARWPAGTISVSFRQAKYIGWMITAGGLAVGTRSTFTWQRLRDEFMGCAR